MNLYLYFYKAKHYEFTNYQSRIWSVTYGNFKGGNGIKIVQARTLQNNTVRANEITFSKGDYLMKWVVSRVLLTILGIGLFALVLKLEIDGSPGFLLATLGLFLIIIGLALKGLINLIANIL